MTFILVHLLFTFVIFFDSPFTLISFANMNERKLQMVLVLKKEVVKTNNAVEHEDTGKYRQLLVRTLHQCTVKFPDVAATIIPVVSVVRFSCNNYRPRKRVGKDFTHVCVSVADNNFRTD